MAANEAYENPWFKKQPLRSSPESCSLQNVMDEELAKALQGTEETQVKFQPLKVNMGQDGNPTCDNDYILAQMLQNDVNQTCDSDYMLAQMLQNQYDFEYDQSLELEERKLNGNNEKGKRLVAVYVCTQKSFFNDYLIDTTSSFLTWFKYDKCIFLIHFVVCAASSISATLFYRTFT